MSNSLWQNPALSLAPVVEIPKHEQMQAKTDDAVNTAQREGQAHNQVQARHALHDDKMFWFDLRIFEDSINEHLQESVEELEILWLLVNQQAPVSQSVEQAALRDTQSRQSLITQFSPLPNA
jgi:hypothetical protein